MLTGDRMSREVVGKRMKRDINILSSLCLRPSPFGPVADMKQALLEAEGVEFCGNGLVKTEKVFY